MHVWIISLMQKYVVMVHLCYWELESANCPSRWRQDQRVRSKVAGPIYTPEKYLLCQNKNIEEEESTYYTFQEAVIWCRNNQSSRKELQSILVLSHKYLYRLWASLPPLSHYWCRSFSPVPHCAPIYHSYYEHHFKWMPGNIIWQRVNLLVVNNCSKARSWAFKAMVGDQKDKRLILAQNQHF